jgi:hypothetical protein
VVREFFLFFIFIFRGALDRKKKIIKIFAGIPKDQRGSATIATLTQSHRSGINTEYLQLVVYIYIILSFNEF